MSRYRVNKIKRMHSIVEGLLPVLEEIAAHPDVAQVTPGRIRPKRRGTDYRVTFQYFTDAGFKLMAHTPEAVQEVFVVTPNPQAVHDYLVEHRLIRSR
ncbi:MAG: hypothetical protein GX161_08845 [Firmicutes bacterium]|jgi:hypothetical protein|nr:hypothetical protein [Bacillota bacterium]